MDRFPLDSVTFDYSDRFGREEGAHHGTDIFAPRGTKVQAVERGYVWRDDDPKGGKVVYLDCPATGHQFYYAHLDSIEDRVPYVRPMGDNPGGAPLPVVAGELIGRVGTTGNAKGTPPHLHFQMRTSVGMPGLPRGVIQDPYPELRKVDPHLVSRPGPWSTPTVGPGSTNPWGVDRDETGPRGAAWWDLSWLGKAGSFETLAVGGLVLWFLSTTKDR